MHETPQGFFHLDQPTPEATLPAGLVKLAGWAAGTNGRHFVDLKIRLGAAEHPVVYGFPRVDLATFFKIPAPFLPGGFEAALMLPAGTTELSFAALDITGQWHLLHQQSITCSAAIENPRMQTHSPVVRPHEFARTLLSVLRDSADLPLQAAAQKLAVALPNPAVLRFPHLPFHGHLHQPTLIERVLFGRLRIEGWLFHETQRIQRVAASVDLQSWQDLELGDRKPYVEAMYPQFSNARGCRIDGLIDVPAQIPTPVCVRLYAELADGSWHLCHVQRVATWEQETEKRPLAPYSLGTFIRASMALGRACRNQGFAITHDRDFWSGLSKARHEYRLRARPAACPAVDSSAAHGEFSTPDAGTAPTPRRITLFTHNLAHEGAPLFLLELAREYRAAGVRLHVISAADGPLSAAYHALGASIQLVDDTPLRTAVDNTALHRALAEFAKGIALSETDLVVANTLSLWWAVHLAHRARRPSLFYLHESSTPATFYLGHMMQDALPLIEASFRLATCASFLTESTRAYYRPWLGRTNHGINPGWIDIAAIDRELAGRSRTEGRARLSIGEDERLIVNVGSVCDRKGQHIFARGVDLLWRQHPDLAANCRFLMVGGRDTLFDRDLRSLLRQFNRENITMVPTTASPMAYYQAADLFACSSYEESLPRVIMEAMAAQLPILSTAVHGINDLLPGPDYGLLIPPGDSQAICTGLQVALTEPAAATQRAARARERVVGHFNSALLLPRHVALAARVASIRL